MKTAYVLIETTARNLTGGQWIENPDFPDRVTIGQVYSDGNLSISSLRGNNPRKGQSGDQYYGTTGRIRFALPSDPAKLAIACRKYASENTTKTDSKVSQKTIEVDGLGIVPTTTETRTIADGALTLCIEHHSDKISRRHTLSVDLSDLADSLDALRQNDSWQSCADRISAAFESAGISIGKSSKSGWADSL